ncbi:MAG TPA: surface-adhesin E family protein [Thermodesulfovibrionales bacterium]|nr:surface-adhesin E family protein [Thermodesulfovibrionales bacterium]
MTTDTDVREWSVKKWLLLCVLIAGTFITGASAEEAYWVPFGKSNIGTAYYDKAGIEQVSANVIRVSVKYSYSSEGVREFREAFPEINAYETVSYSLYLYEMSCSTSSFVLLKAATFNSAGNMIKGTELLLNGNDNSAPQHITPDSLMEQLSDAACGWRLNDR